jgi:hypothetical protein
MRTGNELTENAAVTYSESVAKEINNSAIEIAMSTLADSIEWRSSLSNLQLSGGSSTVTFKDTVVGADSAVVVRSSSHFISGSDTGYAGTQAVVAPADGWVPPVVHGAATAFGPIDDLIGDMYIDGRDYDLSNTLIPGAGKFGVSTGAPTFTNDDGAYIGGTYYVGDTGFDIVPSFPENPSIIETNASWADGWPKTPDQALGLPEGTLKDGKPRVFPVSPPLRGVTYIERPPGAPEWENIALNKDCEGILVFHSDATDAFMRRIITEVPNDYFEGIMIFDRFSHAHLNVLGSLIELSPNTAQENCSGNDNHKIRYSSEAIKAGTQIAKELTDVSWKSRLKVLSWYE